VSITVLIGLQWGDEGKGKMVDILSAEHQHIVRSHGGANAGHTLVIKGQEYKFHLVPSGILYSHTQCYLAGGVVVDPEVFLEELERLDHSGIEYHNRLFISHRAHILLPYHKLLDQALESSRGKGLIGTTGKGIGPCYTDKVSRMGITMEEFGCEDLFKLKIIQRYQFLNKDIVAACPLESLIEKAQVWRRALAPLLLDVEHHLSQALKKKETLLLEGAHGTMLDVSYGTYPFVTSSGCIAASVLAGCGLGPMRVTRVCGVIKAYTTRVGSGPLPTALSDAEQAQFMSHEEAREIGTTTGRLRRMGWLDIPLIRRSIELSGVSDLVLTKLDILDSVKQIKVCTHYLYQDKRIDIFPTDTSILDRLEPQYSVIEGWQVSTEGITHFDELPLQAKNYINKIQEWLKTPVSAVFVGPGREQTIQCL
jgi:adenylosuccinate synthase